MHDGIRVRGHIRIENYSVRTGALLSVVEADNIITTAGKAVLAHLLGADGLTTGLSWLAVGTGSGAPAASDAALFAELARGALTQTVVAGTSGTYLTFFTSSQANGTWTEIGAFGNGASATASSGTLFGHAMISNVKTSAIETIVAYSIAFS